MGFGIAAISIGVLFFLALLVRRTSGISVCALCASVAGTWVWMLVARPLGFTVDPVVLSILMGGSVVGIVYQYGGVSATPLIRLCATLAGFFAAYSLVNEAWLLSVIGIFVFGIFIMLSRRRGIASSSTASAKEIEEKLKKCC